MSALDGVLAAHDLPVLLDALGRAGTKSWCAAANCEESRMLPLFTLADAIRTLTKGLTLRHSVESIFKLVILGVFFSRSAVNSDYEYEIKTLARHTDRRIRRNSGSVQKVIRSAPVLSHSEFRVKISLTLLRKSL